MSGFLQRVGAGTIVLAAGLSTMAGCAKRDDGPPRYQISGAVTYNGAPVPRGFVTFTPDDSAGNEGPGGGAAIVSGRYDTKTGKGVVVGPHFVRIIGYDGKPAVVSGEELQDGQPLFPPYETTVDIPAADSTHDFQVPAESTD